MSPVYAHDGITLYNGDALDVMAELASGSVAAVITDPPYILAAGSMGHQHGKAGTWADMMNAAYWYQSWFAEAWRLLKHDGSFWCFCNWKSLPVFQAAAAKAQIPIISVVVWDKQWIGPGGNQGLRPSYELILLMGKPAFTIPDRGIPDIWQCLWSAHKPSGHPAEKPVKLLSRIIQTCELRPGSLVLDPFAGSGSTLMAARQNGMRGVGIEADERWVTVSRKRLSQELMSFAEPLSLDAIEAPFGLDAEPVTA